MIPQEKPEAFYTSEFFQKFPNEEARASSSMRAVGVMISAAHIAQACGLAASRARSRNPIFASISAYAPERFWPKAVCPCKNGFWDFSVMQDFQATKRQCPARGADAVPRRGGQCQMRIAKNSTRPISPKNTAEVILIAGMLRALTPVP